MHLCVRQAKAIAREWVEQYGRATPGFVGAFLHGSINWQPDDADLPAASDLDIMLVLAENEPPPKPGKFIYNGVLLEVSYLPDAALRTPQQVLAEYNLAGSFHTPSVIADPSGHLARLQAEVSAHYAERRWVRARSRQALNKVRSNLARLEAPAPFHDQVMTVLFAAGVMAHVLLVAGLKNPTVRKRYVAVRELLAEVDRPDDYPPLLEMLGCEHTDRTQVEAHLDALAEAYDAAAGVIRTPFPFASDISVLARPIAIDGTRELIAGGMHREAIFWLAVTYSRCQAVFHHDAPPQTAQAMRQYEAGYRRLLRDLGITSAEDLRRRSAEIQAMLPRLWYVAEQIMGQNSGTET